MATLCRCSDPGCTVHIGSSKCTKLSFIILYRIDMEDSTGAPFCAACAEDAMACGLFTDAIYMESEVEKLREIF